MSWKIGRKVMHFMKGKVGWKTVAFGVFFVAVVWMVRHRSYVDFQYLGFHLTLSDKPPEVKETSDKL